MTTTTRTRLQLAKAITDKRAEQLAAVNASTAEQLGQDLCDLIGEWDAARG